MILKVSDGGPNFKEIAIATRDEMDRAITGSYGEPRDSLVLADGDLSVYPHDTSQQTAILGIQELLGRKIKSPLPNSSAAIKNGVIFGFPVCNHEEEILEPIPGQDVTHVRRLPI